MNINSIRGISVAHGVFANKPGTQQYTIVKDDNNCLSEPAQATVTVKACGLHKSGCYQEAVDYIDQNACEQGAGAGRIDHHSYTLEKKICTGCNINEVWQKYLADVHNQAVVLSDQMVSLSGNNGEKPSMPFHTYMLPDNSGPQPIENCATLQLPRLIAWVRQLSLVVEKLPGTEDLTTVRKYLEKCAKKPESFTDPIFLRVNDNLRCVTNYTKPGTRCIREK